MDPFSAIGLAGNVVQFLDFGGKLASGILELYRSMDGVSSTNKILETITKDITELCAGLIHTGRVADNTMASESETWILSLARSCNELGIEFLSVLERLKVKRNRDKKWESAWKALKSVWKEKQILQYERSLNLYQGQISTRLLKILTYVVFEKL